MIAPHGFPLYWKGFHMVRTKSVLIACITVAALSAHAQVLAFLVEQWWDNGRQMCKYDNGTVLNVGTRTCPLSIKVSP